jgi:surface carbohydrate biosynthesis protein
MDVLIPIETTAREALYKIYLSKLLALQGVNSYLGNKSHIFFLTQLFTNYTYLDKGYHQGTSDVIYEKIRDNNGKIINLDEEGAVDFPENSILKSRYSKTLFESSDHVFLWGESQFNLIKDNITDLNKITITGHPRFELLKNKFHILYKSEVNKINSKYGKYILINTNMGFGNNLKGDEFVEANYKSRFKNINEIISFDKEKCKSFISLIKKLAAQYDGNIIFRPHPEEKLDIYEDAFDSINNIKVLFKGSAIDWIIGSELMIHPDCTTAIESSIIGRKAISFLPSNYNSSLVTKLPLDVSIGFTDEKALLKYIKNENHKKVEKQDENINKIIENHFSVSKNSSLIIKDEIVKLFPKKIDVKNTISLKNYLSLLVLSIKLKFGSSETHRLVRQKLQGIENHNFKNMNSLVNRINPEFKKVKMKKVSYGLYKFYSNK